MPYADLARQRAYQRAWMQRRREEWFDDKTCVNCGTSENLELHHRDPAKKVAHAIWSWREDRRKAELAKCVALCADCHLGLHQEATRYPCGTEARYRRGCRCQPCRDAHAERRRDYVARRSRGEVHRQPTCLPLRRPLQDIAA